MIVTTSWDDGDPADLRIADLLEKYGLSGTFYIPRSAPNVTLSPAQIRGLSSRFEIGAHTLDHVVLTRTDEETARSEIVQSKAWIEDVTGSACVMFCPPQGRFKKEHVRMVGQAGYLGMRTVELFSTERPRRSGGIFVMPTSMQVFPHRHTAIMRNLVKRYSFVNLLRYFCLYSSGEWLRTAEAFIRHVSAGGGLFHIWGHSWEIEQLNLWSRLEELLSFISSWSGSCSSATNGDCVQMAALKHHRRIQRCVY
ncbi:polysaccharide deacetylase family protein [Methylobacterium sp. P31]